jgi:DUF4097 and DUF4098 domain-containing protein YvlB
MIRNERWDVGERPSIDLRVPVGSIEVCADNAGVVSLMIDAPEVDDYEIFKTGDRISVRHPSRWGRRGRQSRVVALVPPGSDVELSSASGDLRLTGRFGTVRLHTASGGMVMGDADRLDVTTASGELTCGEVEGQTTISSVSGEVTIRRVGGGLDVTITSGDLRIDRCDGDVSINTTSGDVRVARCCGNEISVRSISGDVRVGLPSGIRVEAEISTLSGRASLPEPAPSSEQVDRRPVRLQLKTVSGDIRVERTV